MTNVPSRSSSGVRLGGDDYQHLVTWNEVMLALRPWSGVRDITVEAPHSFNLDDVVVAYHDAPTRYSQVKHAVDATSPVGTQWLMTPAGKRTLLQKFHDSWRQMADNGGFYMQLVTDREADSTDGLMKGLDRRTELLMPVAMSDARAVAEARATWLEHLGIDADELARFLSDLRFRTGRPFEAEIERAQSLMYGNGLNADRAMVELGITMVRQWVQERDRTLDTATLRTLAEERVGRHQEPGAVLIVQGIAYDLHPEDADELVDFVGRYPEIDPDLRRDLNDDSEWQQIGDEIAQSCGRLKAAGHTRVVVRGAMRLPVWFVTGANLRHNHGVSIALLQRGEMWSSTDAMPSAGLCATTSHHLGAGDDIAVAVGVATDPTRGVLRYAQEAGLPVHSVEVIQPAAGAGPEVIVGSVSAATMAVAVRDAVRDIIEDHPGVNTIHLFLATPGGFAALLGHRWNAVRPTIIYEHRGVGHGYTPTFIINA